MVLYFCLHGSDSSIKLPRISEYQFRAVEVHHILDLVEQFMPVSFQTWQTVADFHLEWYGLQLHMAESLQRKFLEFCRRTGLTGDPNWLHWKQKSGASYVSRGNTLGQTLCLNIMSFRFTVWNELNGLSTDRLIKVWIAENPMQSHMIRSQSWGDAAYQLRKKPHAVLELMYRATAALDPSLIPARVI
jgi:hypothetical protein